MKRVKIVENNQNNKKPKKEKLSESNGNSAKIKSTIKDGHSIEEGKNMFQWIIDGIGVDEFMK